MRPLALLLCLLWSAALAAAELSLAQKKQLLIEGASAAAAAMGRAQHYVQFLPPMPATILDAAAIRSHVLFDGGWSHHEKWGTWSLSKRRISPLTWPRKQKNNPELCTSSTCV